MRATLAVCVFPPPVPLMVMVNVFSVAVVPTLTVIVDVPEPGAPMGLGLKVTFCSPPAPVADNLIAELKLPRAAVVILAVPDAPRATVIAVGDALMVKSALTAEVTIRATVVVCVMPSPTPATVIV